MLGLSHNRVNNLRLCFENKLSHFFLPPTVNKWIQKRIQNSKRAGPLKGNGWLFLSSYLWEEHWNWSWNNQGRERKTIYTVVFSALLYLGIFVLLRAASVEFSSSSDGAVFRGTLRREMQRQRKRRKNSGLQWWKWTR